MPIRCASKPLPSRAVANDAPRARELVAHGASGIVAKITKTLPLEPGETVIAEGAMRLHRTALIRRPCYVRLPLGYVWSSTLLFVLISSPRFRQALSQVLSKLAGRSSLRGQVPPGMNAGSPSRHGPGGLSPSSACPIRQTPL